MKQKILDNKFMFEYIYLEIDKIEEKSSTKPLYV